MTGDEYTPTTEHIREYVEIGGEPRPWLPPTPDEDAKRAAAFDRWLAAHDAQVAEKAWDGGAKAGFGASPILTRGQLLATNPYRNGSHHA